jgi:meiotic recombination protein REC8
MYAFFPSYGVSRVFSQQCGYILSDAENFQANMRAFVNAIKTSELDPNAGKARYVCTAHGMIFTN